MLDLRIGKNWRFTEFCTVVAPTTSQFWRQLWDFRHCSKLFSSLLAKGRYAGMSTPASAPTPSIGFAVVLDCRRDIDINRLCCLVKADVPNVLALDEVDHVLADILGVIADTL